VEPALALLEFDSIARGIEAGDAMAKRAPIRTLKAGTVQPGKFLVLIAGEVADVEESLAAGKEVGLDHLVDEVYLPQVHPDVVRAITGGRVGMAGEALGVIETRTVAATILAADAGRKGAEVSLLEVRLGDGLGGKGFCLFSGLVADVEAAIQYGIGALPDAGVLVREVVIPSLHGEMAANVLASTRFADTVGRSEGARE
jgi:microcompartment protein CcmL/EutN